MEATWIEVVAELKAEFEACLPAGMSKAALRRATRRFDADLMMAYEHGYTLADGREWYGF